MPAAHDRDHPLTLPSLLAITSVCAALVCANCLAQTAQSPATPPSPFPPLQPAQPATPSFPQPPPAPLSPLSPEPSSSALSPIFPGQPANPQRTDPARYVSIIHEIRWGINRATDYLVSRQNSDGSWGSPASCETTARVLTAWFRSPAFIEREASDTTPLPDPIRKGITWLLSCQRDDGAFAAPKTSGTNLTRATSAAILALIASGEPDLTPRILKARQFLLARQSPGKPDGGGFAPSPDADSQPDMETTSAALEALHFSQALAAPSRFSSAPSADFPAARRFITSCLAPQSSPAAGMASPRPTPDSRPRPSTTANALLALHFAQTPHDDPSSQLASLWLTRNLNFTRLPEAPRPDNPAKDKAAKGKPDRDNPPGDTLDAWTLAIAKALAFSGRDVILLPDTRRIDWRISLAETLVASQQSDGSWPPAPPALPDNAQARLVASLNLTLALEAIFHSIPRQQAAPN